MRRLGLLLFVLVALIQWPLWFGSGGWMRVGVLQRELDARLAANEQLREANRGLVSEIASFQDGSEAAEERARFELHMARPDETYFQWVGAPAPKAEAPAPVVGP